MPDGQVLEFTNVTKRFNEVTAVSDFSARVEPGAVTAFLGPNGAGKTTTLRILLGQVRATSGTATIGGTAYAELRQPLRTIGAVLEDAVYRTRRTASRQLTIAAKANGIPLSRVDEVLAMVGLEGEGDSRIGGFSLGMRQRLSVANALLGDPGALVFDEPANGLDPEGIRWMRLLMRRLADEGRTVLVSSHLLSEIEQVADNVLVLSKGHLVLASGIETLADPKGGSVVVDAADRAALTAALSAAGFDVEVLRSGLTVRGGDAGTVGAVAADAGIALSTLVQRGPTLEDVFIDLVRGGKLGARAGAVGTGAIAAGAVTGMQLAEVAEDAETDSRTPGDESAAADGAVAVDDIEDAADENAVEHDGVVADGADGEETTVEVTLDETPGAAAQDSVDAASEESSEDEADGTHDESESAADEAGADAAPDENATPRSFDEILFGASGAGAASAEGETAAESGTEPHGEDDHAGVEFFTGFGETDAAGETSPVDEAAANEHESDSSEQDPDDPRSAAVSSMLAAAARAYYEDEPKDYPQGESAPEEGRHWSVASTGVIDTVPFADESASEHEADAAEPGVDRDEHDGESHGHDGETHEHEGESHGHDGETHEHGVEDHEHEHEHHENGDHHHG